MFALWVFDHAVQQLLTSFHKLLTRFRVVPDTCRYLFSTPLIPFSLQPPTDGHVHNYSSQTLNSTELAKNHLRRRLAQDPTHRYTYCQDYHSMTVVPIDVEAEERARR